MSVILEDRPIEQVREQTIDQLIYNYSHGVISAEAFERRLDQAMASQSHQEIVDLVKDLPLDTDKQYRAEKEQLNTPNYGASTNSEPLNIMAVLGGADRSGRWPVPAKINVSNFLGDAKLDLTDAEFQSQTVTINVLDVLGNTKIYVPEGVNVVCQSYNIIGSVDNKAPSISNRQAPTIVITGKVVLGSLSISIKRTMKEKFVEFANSLKQAFDTKHLM